MSTQPTFDPESVFIWAVAFERAAEQIKHVIFAPIHASGRKGTFVGQICDGTVFNLTVPWAVNSAFALELYLKCLNFVTTGTMPWGHNLLSLFDQVQPQQRQQIEHRYHESLRASGYVRGEHVAPSIPIDAYDVRAILADNRNAFAELRYPFELSSANFACERLVAAVRQTILDSQPTWECHAAPYKQPT